jgi:hypothetical protein
MSAMVTDSTVLGRTAFGCFSPRDRSDDPKDLFEHLLRSGAPALEHEHERRFRMAVAPGPGTTPEDVFELAVTGCTDGEGRDELGRAHRRMAREALRGFDLPRAMREALLSVMDHGHDGLRGLLVMTAESRDPLWELAGFLARHPAMAWCLPRTRAFKAIERGLPVRDALRLDWPGLGDAHLRRLAGPGFTLAGGLQTRGLGREDTDHIVLQAVAAIPHDRIPDPAAWPAFSRVAVVAGAVAMANRIPLAPLMALSDGTWPDVRARLMRILGPRLPAGHAPDSPAMAALMHGAAMDSRDARDALCGDLVLPLLAHLGEVRGGSMMDGNDGAGPEPGEDGVPLPDLRELATDVAARVLYGGRSIAKAISVSAEWHRRRAAIAPGVTGGHRGGRAWPSLLPDGWPHGAVRIVALADAMSLGEEGSADRDRDGIPGMGHCVAGRLSRYRDGEAHALSIRLDRPDGSWERIATAEVSVTAADAFAVTECRGVGNGPAPVEAREALASLARAVASGEVRMGPEAMERRRPRPTTLSETCGYDWRDADRLASAASAWRVVLPRWFRPGTPEAMEAALFSHGALEPGWEGGIWRFVPGDP